MSDLRSEWTGVSNRNDLFTSLVILKSIGSGEGKPWNCIKCAKVQVVALYRHKQKLECFACDCTCSDLFKFFNTFSLSGCQGFFLHRANAPRLTHICAAEWEHIPHLNAHYLVCRHVLPAWIDVAGACWNGWSVFSQLLLHPLYSVRWGPSLDDRPWGHHELLWKAHRISWKLRWQELKKYVGHGDFRLANTPFPTPSKSKKSSSAFKNGRVVSAIGRQYLHLVSQN